MLALCGAIALWPTLVMGQQVANEPNAPAIDLMIRHRTELQLSADQLNNLRTIQFDFERAYARATGELQAALIDIEQSQTRNPPDLSKRDVAVKRVQALRTDLWLAQLSATDKAREVLTPQQRELFASFEPAGALEPQLGDSRLRDQVQLVLKDLLKDQKVVEIETTQAIVSRISEWATFIGLFVGIPIAILGLGFGFLGIKSYSDFKKVVRTAQKEVNSRLTEALAAAKKPRRTSRPHTHGSRVPRSRLGPLN